MSCRPTGNARDDQTLGRLLVIASAITWSSTGLFTRLIPLDSWTLLVWRGFFGALGLLLVILVLERRQGLKAFFHLSWPGLLFVVLSSASMLAFITALRLTSVAHVAIIYAAVPVAAGGLAWLLLGERPGLRAVLCSLAALLGVGVMVGLSGEGGLVGDLLAVGMMLGMAAVMVTMRRFKAIAVMQAACLSTLLSSFIAWLAGGQLTIDHNNLFFLLLFGLTNSALGLAFFTFGARRIAAIETALIGALEAPLAPIWVWWAFGETPSTTTLLGGGIVFLAVALYLWNDVTMRSRSR